MLSAPRIMRYLLETKGVNLTLRGQSLGMTPFDEVIKLLKSLAPYNYGHKEIRIGADSDGDT